jgi:hypothetical protein
LHAVKEVLWRHSIAPEVSTRPTASSKASTGSDPAHGE